MHSGFIQLSKFTHSHVAVPIEAIKELRTGSDTRYYRIQFKKPEELEERWITIIYILDGAYKTLHIVADTRDVFQLWNTSLRKLHAIRQGLMAGLGNVEMRQNVWERQYWKGADEEGDQVLDFDDIERLCMRLNVNLKTPDLQKLFKVCIVTSHRTRLTFQQEADTENKGYLDYPKYQKFVRNLKRRPEVEGIYEKLCTANGGKFDLAGFTKFLKEYQKALSCLFLSFEGTNTQLVYSKRRRNQVNIRQVCGNPCESKRTRHNHDCRRVRRLPPFARECSVFRPER